MKRIIAGAVVATVSLVGSVYRYNRGHRSFASSDPMVMAAEERARSIQVSQPAGSGGLGAEVYRMCTAVSRCVGGDTTTLVNECLANVHRGLAPLESLTEDSEVVEGAADDLAARNDRCEHDCDHVLTCYQRSGGSHAGRHDATANAQRR